MECVEFEQLLQQRLDERLAPVCPELDSHAATCPACHLLLEDARLLSRGVAAWRMSAPVAPSDLASRITEQTLAIIRDHHTAAPTTIKRQQQVVPSDALQSWQSWAVLAGTVAAVWFVFLGSTVPHSTNSSRAVVRNGALTQQARPKADLGVVLVSAGGAYSHLANESLAAARDFALLWPAGSGSATVDTSDPQSDEADTGWSPDLSEELAPIGDSVEDAWNFLRRTVPQVEKMRT